VWGILTTTTPGVTIMTGTSTWPNIPGGGTAANTGPNFTFKVNTPCNTLINFRLEMRYDGNQVARSSWTVRVGKGQNVALLSDEFETEKGWSASGATAGAWVREDPHGTMQNGNQAQPEDDHSPSGTRCRVTGNPTSNDPNAGDVDGGTVTLTSPTFN